MKILSRLGLAIIVVLSTLTAIPKAEDLYPDVVEISHADPAVVKILKSYFTAKSRQQVDATMDHFRRDMLTYSDATLGWETSDFESQRKIFASYMPHWGKGRSYPTRIIGGPKSAIVEFTGTPELFGGELRIFGAVDFKDGKILRWVDYWDSTTYDHVALQKILTPKDRFPVTYREDRVGGDNASPHIVTKAKAFQKSLAEGDTAAVADMLTYDAVYEDAVLHTQIIGRSSIQAYLSHVLSVSPFGRGSTLRHIVGGDMGGGFEWSGTASSPVRVGITSITLDPDGQISSVAVMYDGRLLPRAEKERLVLLSMDR